MRNMLCDRSHSCTICLRRRRRARHTAVCATFRNKTVRRMDGSAAEAVDQLRLRGKDWRNPLSGGGGGRDRRRHGRLRYR